jgi:hypothetical protein
MTDPFKGLLQGYQAAQQIQQAPQLNQLNLLQQQAKLEQLQGLDPLTQQQISESKTREVGLSKEQEAEAQKIVGTYSYLAKQMAPEQRELFFSALGKMGVDMMGLTPEELDSSAIIGEQLLRKPEASKVGRFEQSVVGGKLVLVDSVTGEQQVMDLQPGMKAPESFTDEQKKQWESLPPSSQQKIIEKNLDPAAQLKTQEKLKSIQKKDQFKSVALDLINKITNSKELPNVLGPLEGSIDFRLEGSEAELIADIKELESILTGENLDLMTGVLSESDIAILRQIGAGGLNRQRSPKEFKRRLDELKESLSGFGKTEFIPGKVYTDANGNKAKFNKDGTWTEM